MKNMFESSEVFQAYARIDYCYHMIELQSKELGKPVAPIVRMIDDVTGYDRMKTKEQIDTSISLIEEVIRSKNIVDADYSADQRFLNGLKELKSKWMKEQSH